MSVLYFDSSALVKLVVTETGTDAIRDQLVTSGMWATSDLGYTEVQRAINRRQPDSWDDAWQMMNKLSRITLDRDMYDLAGRLQPARLRSLDAIHVAAALSIGSDLTAVVTYDKRLAEAAQLNGIPVLSPGVDNL